MNVPRLILFGFILLVESILSGLLNAQTPTLQHPVNNIAFGCQGDSIVIAGTHLTSSQLYINSAATNPANYSINTSGTSITIHFSPLIVGDSLPVYVQGGGHNSDTILLTVYHLPTLSLTPVPTPLCHGSSQALTATPAQGTAPYTYHWSTAATSASVTVMPANNTTYAVTVTDAHQCRVVDSVSVTLYPIATASITSSLGASFCANLTDSLHASNSHAYLWGTGATTRVIPVTTSSTYSLTTTDTHGCTATASTSITVNPVPVVNLGIDTAVCGVQTITLGGSSTVTAGTAPYTYHWSTSSTATSASITVTPSIGSTAYSLTVTDVHSCTATGSKTITVNPVPVVHLGNDTHICMGDTLQLGGNGVVVGGVMPYTYQWSTASTDATIRVSPSVNTNYSLGVTDSHSCIGRDTVFVRVDSIPDLIATITPDSSLCSGKAFRIDFTGHVLATHFDWTASATSGLTGFAHSGVDSIRQVVMNTSNLIQQLTYTIIPRTATCVGDSIKKHIRIYPVARFTGNTAYEICNGTATDIQLTGNLSTATYTWQAHGIGAISGSGNGGGYIHDTWSNSTSSPVDEQYMVTASAFGCRGDSVSVTVRVNPFPSFSLSPATQTSASGVASEINAISSVSSVDYSWIPVLVSGDITGQDSATGQTMQQVLTNRQDRVYGMVRYVVSSVYPLSTGAGFCPGQTDTAKVTVLPSSSIPGIFIPTVLTPNGDGMNDNWKIKIESGIDVSGYKIAVYSRNGTQLWPESSLQDAMEWNFSNVPAGTYLYLLKGPDLQASGKLSILH